MISLGRISTLVRVAEVQNVKMSTFCSRLASLTSTHFPESPKRGVAALQGPPADVLAVVIVHTPGGPMRPSQPISLQPAYFSSTAKGCTKKEIS